MATDLFDQVTQAIIAALEASPAKLDLPWHRSAMRVPWNAATGRPYRGSNVLALWLSAAAREYPDGPWASYRQWQELGAQVRKGESATPILFYRQAREDDADTEEQPQRFWVVRTYRVFNVAQVDNWTPPPVPEPLRDEQRIQQAEAFFGAVGGRIIHEGEQALYNIAADTICMPPFARFKSVLGYYAVLAHEHIHWTGAAHRLDRGFTSNSNALAYAGEELVAEFGAAFLCAALQLSVEPRPDHAKYIASWLKLLREDKHAISRAVSLATQAVEFLTAEAASQSTQRAAHG